MMTEKFNPATPNFRTEAAAKLAQLFPEIVSDGEIDFDALQEALSDDLTLDGGNEKYGFTWRGKRDTKRIADVPAKNTTLIANKEKSKNWDSTQNVYIEGDNLEVLKLLQKSYAEKIKLIYLEPPYNTGKDFVYKDDFHDSYENYLRQTGQVDSEGNATTTNKETNGRFHTDWLNMMYPRLKLARKLLWEDGVIMISLDENEIVNLRNIMNEIFGSENFFTQVIVQSNKRGQTYKQIAKTHEYLLIYTNRPETEFNELEKSDDNNDLNLLDDISNFNIRELRNRNPKFGRFNRPNLFYPIFVAPDLIDKNGFNPVSLLKTEKYSMEILPLNSAGEDSCWRWGRERTEKNSIENTMVSDLVAKRKSDGGYNVYEKYRKTTYKPKSIWDSTDFITEKGTVELGTLGLSSYFEFPKPVNLIKQIIEIGANKNDVILDFFSSSSTTAHAVMKLNAEDGGKRKFIMVQLPEIVENSEYKTIPEIAQERIRRAGEKIKVENPLTTQDLDIGFKVYELSKSTLKQWDENPLNFESQLDLFDSPFVAETTNDQRAQEIALKSGISLDIDPTVENGIYHYLSDDKEVFVVLGNYDDKLLKICNEKRTLPVATIVLQELDNGSELKFNLIEILKQNEELNNHLNVEWL